MEFGWLGEAILLRAINDWRIDRGRSDDKLQITVVDKQIDNVSVADKYAPHRFRRGAVRSFGQSPSVGELQDAEVVEANPVFGLRRTIVALDADLVLARGR